MTNLPFAATTPVSVARVGLRARNGERVADYYKHVLGLTETRRAPGVIGLGAHGRELLEIEQSNAFREDDPASAGLYHTAFLFPSRADLSRWAHHAIDQRIRIDGASDHLVSEAFYLTDPEGNGVEIYADRDPANWVWDKSRVEMATRPIGLQGLLAETGDGGLAGWHGAPDGTVVGHVHLRVGDAGTAEAWWNDEMDFDTVAGHGGVAVFLSTGGYHHHIGANVWHSRGAGQREEDRTGLSFVELSSKRDGEGGEKRDPWGNRIRLIEA